MIALTECSLCKCLLAEDYPEFTEIDGHAVCDSCLDDEQSICCGGCEFQSICSVDPLNCVAFDLHIDAKFKEECDG